MKKIKFLLLGFLLFLTSCADKEEGSVGKWGDLSDREGTLGDLSDPTLVEQFQDWITSTIGIVVLCAILAVIVLTIVVICFCFYANKKFTVTLEQGDAKSQLTVRRGERLQLPLIKKDGYRFGGWYIDTAMTIPFDQRKKVKYDMTLYAKWVKEAE